MTQGFKPPPSRQAGGLRKPPYVNQRQRVLTSNSLRRQAARDYELTYACLSNAQELGGLSRADDSPDRPALRSPSVLLHRSSFRAYRGSAGSVYLSPAASARVPGDRRHLTQSGRVLKILAALRMKREGGGT
jgi:hypothetical protein